MQSFRRVEKRACANRWKWPEFRPKRAPEPLDTKQMSNTQLSMEINPKLVKQLREKTNAGYMDCKRALEEAGGDLAKGETILRTKGIASASKKASRVTKEGIVAAYIHLQGKVGVLVEVNCETDFVAKNENFRGFVKDITLHIAAAHPLYVRREQVPAQLTAAERGCVAVAKFERQWDWSNTNLNAISENRPNGKAASRCQKR